MTEKNIFLNEITIKNYLSLHNISLPLRPLTILVGPNASGKSNVLRAISLLSEMMNAPEPPPNEYLYKILWAGGADCLSYKLSTKINKNSTCYKLKLTPGSDNLIALEELTVDKAKIISIQDGQGEVRDEKDENIVTKYRPAKPKLALTSAGDYGEKPVTSALTKFIQNFEFYNFEPDIMRKFSDLSQMKNLPEFSNLDDDGSILALLLSNWHENASDLFQSVNEEIKKCIKLGIGKADSEEDFELGLTEGYKKLIPMSRASDGTLRLIAYQVLLNQPEIPAFIAVEEPERNLHPAALKDVAAILEQLSERTQVIITTHSSQLLDAFNPASLSGNLGVLLLKNVSGKGTEVIDLEEARKNQKSLDGWIEDFGIGSAIFDSELIPD